MYRLASTPFKTLHKVTRYFFRYLYFTSAENKWCAFFMKTHTATLYLTSGTYGHKTFVANIDIRDKQVPFYVTAEQSKFVSMFSCTRADLK